MTNQRTVHRHRGIAALVLAASVCLPAIAACGSDDDPSETEGTTTSSTAPPESTAPPTTLTKEQEVEAAFHEFDSVLAELALSPNPDDPRLPQLILEPLLTDLRGGLQQRQASNQVYEISELSTVDILSTTIDSTGLTATVVVCVVDADRLIDRDTGDVVAEGTETAKDEARFRLENGRWMLADYLAVTTWDGATSCSG